MTTPTTVVIDAGSSLTRAGMGGEPAPRCVLPTVVGTPRHVGVTSAMLNRPTGIFVGHDAFDAAGLLAHHPPIAGGLVADWDALEALAHHLLFSELGVAPEAHPILWSESPAQTRADRERVVELFMEHFTVPAVGMSHSLAASLFACGATTGLAIESGSERTSIGAVWEGYCLPHALRTEAVGGQAVTAHLRDLLRRKGYPFSTRADDAVLEQIKCKSTYIAADVAAELRHASQSRNVTRFFALPDGERVFVREERFLAPELVLSPAMATAATVKRWSAHLSGDSAVAEEPVHHHRDSVDNQKGFHCSGWHDVACRSISYVGKSLQPELYGNIVLSGGNTLFPNIEDRLHAEIKRCTDGAVTVKCEAKPSRQYSAWLGASIMTTLGTFPAQLVSKAEYDETGAHAIHCKC